MSRMINKVEICGVNTAELPVLTNEQMRTLFQRMRQGDQEARQQLVQGNLRLVLSVIQRFNHRGEPVDDLFQVGCIGLMKAIDNFDLDQNVRFSTYAVPMIIGEIRRYLRDNTPIRVSRSLRDVAYKALQVRDQLTHRHGREPTLEEIARELGSRGRRSSTPWTPSRIPSPCSSRSTRTAATPSTWSTRSATTSSATSSGWRASRFARPCPAWTSASS